MMENDKVFLRVFCAKEEVNLSPIGEDVIKEYSYYYRLIGSVGLLNITYETCGRHYGFCSDQH
ncbi:MAG: hypothetical protein Pg6B_09780 [Candidatus Azobacteroides pseudotrichonymphae]|jgi:hypothetical protein|nr:MAG: hypothetical protein Pg6B_09780 [Candidatus Azobacteroides pseudotrichonymphae]